MVVTDNVSVLETVRSANTAGANLGQGPSNNSSNAIGWLPVQGPNPFLWHGPLSQDPSVPHVAALDFGNHSSLFVVQPDVLLFLQQLVGMGRAWISHCV